MCACVHESERKLFSTCPSVCRASPVEDSSLVAHWSPHGTRFRPAEARTAPERICWALEFLEKLHQSNTGSQASLRDRDPSFTDRNVWSPSPAPVHTEPRSSDLRFRKFPVSVGAAERPIPGGSDGVQGGSLPPSISLLDLGAGGGCSPGSWNCWACSLQMTHKWAVEPSSLFFTKRLLFDAVSVRVCVCVCVR